MIAFTAQQDAQTVPTFYFKFTFAPDLVIVIVAFNL
jgi:hypothetical protein